MAEAALAATEPTVEDDGFSPEERSQFESMRDSGPGPAPEAPAADPALSPAVDPAVAPAAPPAGAAEPSGDDDGGEDDDEPAAAAPVPGAVVDPNAAKPPRRVAYGKFARVERRAKAAEAETTKLREQQARLDERLKIINEAMQTPAQQPQQPVAEEDPEPDPETDIFGHNKWLRRQMQRQGETLQQLQEGRTAETENTELTQAYTTDAEQFAVREPNFIPAYQHLMQSRMVELAMYYFGKDLTAADATPLTGPQLQRIKQTVASEERQLATEAIKQGLSPAQRVYQLARARGYRPAAAAAPAPTNGAARPGNGAAPPAPNGKAPAAPGSLAVAPAAPAAPSITDEIARIKNGQEASLSLSGGGSAPQSPMTAERLANMPQEEYEAWVENTPPHIMKQLMGG